MWISESLQKFQRRIALHSDSQSVASASTTKKRKRGFSFIWPGRGFGPCGCQNGVYQVILFL